MASHADIGCLVPAFFVAMAIVICVISGLLVIDYIMHPPPMRAEQAPPEPPRFHEVRVDTCVARLDDYERGVTCYRSTCAGGVWCYESGVAP